MTRKAIKNISIILVIMATLLLIFDMIHLRPVLATEKGIWDLMQGFPIRALFIAYPILLLVSYVLFILSKGEATKIEFIPNVLFLLNGIVLVIFLVMYLTQLARNL